MAVAAGATRELCAGVAWTEGAAKAGTEGGGLGVMAPPDPKRVAANCVPSSLELSKSLVAVAGLVVRRGRGADIAHKPEAADPAVTDRLAPLDA